MNGALALSSFILSAFIIFFVPPLVASARITDYESVTIFDTSSAILLCLGIAGVFALCLFRKVDYGSFLMRLFIAALLIRIVVGTAIFVTNAQTFFGGDAFTYDAFGYFTYSGWNGNRYLQLLADEFNGKPGSGWGMVYLVAGIYTLLGRNMLAVQFVDAVLGAATAPIVFLCAQAVFNHTRVSRVAALCAAFTPSLILWSSQGLKDGPIMFFLALAVLCTLRLGAKLSLIHAILLVTSLFCILAFRFYVFYMMVISIVAAFVMGMGSVTATNFFRQTVAIILLGLSLSYLGITRYASAQFDSYGSLDAVQQSRIEAATSGQSGFGRDTDVSTMEGAVATIPLGLAYLLFAPFPWELGSLRSIITLPETLIWWGSFPFLVIGLWYSIRYRLRAIAPMLIFTVMLSLAYSIFQGNVGNAYRQRAQLQIFWFIFVAVGYVVIREKREGSKETTDMQVCENLQCDGQLP